MEVRRPRAMTTMEQMELALWLDVRMHIPTTCSAPSRNFGAADERK